MHVAARKGEHRLCRKLIEEGAVINARDYAGWTPLHEACYHGHFKVAKLLLGYAKIWAFCFSFSVWIFCVSHRNMD